MTLRTRLVLALVLLSSIGLVAFGFTTYRLYLRSQLRQLDEQLEDNSNPLSNRLRATAGRTEFDSCAADALGTGTETGTGGFGGGRNGGPFGPGAGLDAYARLLSADGTELSCIDPVSTSATPDLPDGLTAPAVGSRLLTVGSTEGTGKWRVLVTRVDDDAPGFGPGTTSVDSGEGGTVIVAVSTRGIQTSMRRLVRIEFTAAVVLLSTLAGGAWLILRRGLRPLEEMAGSAATITAGDLSERVAPADDRTEVGQLGLALNTMLDGIEVSFREREASEARLRQFLADASHELRTPLTSIQGFAELFRLGVPDERVDLPVILRRIEQESERMKHLVEDLLLLARLDQTREPATDPVDLAVIAADACSDAVAMAPDRQVSLDAPVPVVVLGDAHLLRQAAANLVTNALKHTPAGTPIEVHAAADATTARLIVRDHGPGLDAEAKAHVFDRFWQADRARVGSGAGLGLSIVAGIAEDLGGRARVDDAPGGGAVFTLELPVAPTPSAG